MVFFTPGNIITLCISVVLILLFRQMDSNNRSIEKVKKFGDKLKDELESFIRERSAKLDESSIALDVQQAKAVAAVNRLESIREEIAKKEEGLLERTKAVSEFGKQIESYDATIKQLLEMTALAEKNLSRITSESDFADSLGKKLLASQKQLADISAEIPALRDRFAQENRAVLDSIHADTMAKLSGTVSDLEKRIENAHKSGTEIVSTATEKMKEIYQKALAEAARRADTLEDSAFAKLKEQAAERLAKYKEAIDEKSDALHEQTKEKLQETQQLIKGFKSDWQSEANDFLEATRAEIRQLESDSGDAIARIEEHVKSAESLSETRVDEIKGEMHRIETSLDTSLAALSEKTGSALASYEQQVTQKLADTGVRTETRIGEIETRMDDYRKDVDYRLVRFDGLIGDVDRLDGQLRAVMQETEKRVNGDFALYAQDQEARQDAFSKKLIEQAEGLSARMAGLESGLNELKSRAYDNVSEKLKMFEDDFFSDLAKRSDAITAALEQWKTNVDERLETLSADSESSRKDVETAYTVQLKERLAAISEQSRAQSAKLEEQLASVEAELRQRITASDQSILTFIEQYRGEFEQAKKTAELHVQNELDAHALSVQEILRKQEREVDGRTKEFIASIETAKNDSEAVLETVRHDFTAWQSKNEQQIAETRTQFTEKIAALGSANASAIAELEAAYKTGYRDFVASTAEERKLLKDSLDALKASIAAANSDFDHRSADALAGFSKAYETMNGEAELSARSLRTMVQEARDSIEQTREKLFQKVQGDTNALGQTLEEIDKKQKAFIAQTKIFDRADELKTTLEANIETLKNEITRLDVYRDTMNTLEQQYGKVRKLEEEANQKVTRFMTERKRIDILEGDFNKLLGLSDSIDKKISELTLTNDDLQQYQVQIRRFEESVTEVNGRYERLEKKAVVLDQTTEGIDKAFETLKTLETSLADYRNTAAGMPAEIGELKKSLDALLENKEKTSLMVEKLSTLDTILDDVEKRTEKMQTAREWLARTETRLDEISKQSQDQLKLLGDLLKDDGAAKKSKGAPPIGIRENVVKLAHQGWKVDEIARALHLSRGEVELILELPQK